MTKEKKKGSGSHRTRAGSRTSLPQHCQKVGLRVQDSCLDTAELDNWLQSFLTLFKLGHCDKMG